MAKFFKSLNLEKYLNDVSSIFAIIWGAISYLLGGWDILIRSLLIMMALDYLSGLIKGLYKKELSSKTGYKGILKKFLTLIIVSVAVLCEKIGVPAVREVTIIFFLVNEGISVLENASQIGLPIPETIKAALLQIRETKGGN